MWQKIWWYVRKFLNFLFVSLEVLLFGVFHPKRFLFELLVPLVQTINEFHQVTYTRILNFSQTQMCRDIGRHTVFAMSNVFNMDFNVTRPSETQILSALVRYLKPKRIFEIGTYYGFTTLHMAVNTADDCVIHTLDLPPGYDPQDTAEAKKIAYSDLLVLQLSLASQNKRIYKGRPESAKIQELFGNSMKFDFSPYYGQMDVVFIDGNHSGPYVRSDTEAALKMLSPTGIIIWHDFDFIFHRDIYAYLNEFARTHKIYFIPKTRFVLYGPNTIKE